MVGYGLQRNEQMVDRVLQDCVKYSVQSDIVLLNGATYEYVRYNYLTFRNSVPPSRLHSHHNSLIYHYICRCDNPQKAIDLFDAVMSDADANINSDKKSYSNKEKQDTLKISRSTIISGITRLLNFEFSLSLMTLISLVQQVRSSNSIVVHIITCRAIFVS